MGDWLGIVALSVLVFGVTGSTLATTLLFLGTSFLPALLTPFFVARLEHPPPRFVLATLYAAEAVAFAMLTLLADNFSLAAIVAIAAIDAALALTAKTLTRAIAAAMLEPAGELRAGNAILNTAFATGMAVGPAIAGVVVATFGVETALLLDAVSFYAIAWLMLTAKPLPQSKVEAEAGLWDRVRDGLGYIRRQATLRRLLVAEIVALAFFSVAVPIEVVYAKDSLEVGDAGYGLLLASWGVGMVLGSIIFATVRRSSLLLLLFFSTCAIGVSYLGMAAAPALAAACAAAVVGGTGNGVQWVAVVSAVQELTPPQMQARVLGTLESSASAVPGIGFLLGGVIAEVTDPRTAFYFAGAGILVTVALAAPLLGRKWPEHIATSGSNELDGGNDVVLELIPGSRSIQSDPEVLR
jgi:predicted MFS family arabinose efflux permease